MTKIYEAEQVINELRRRDYYETIFAKVKVTLKEYDKFIKLNIPGPGFVIPRLWEYRDRTHELIHVGEEYIVSICNTYHQQNMNMKLIMIHHNVTRNENIVRYLNEDKDYWLKKDFEDDKYA